MEAFNACSSSFRRPYTEVGSLLYVLIGMLSTTSTILLLRSFRSSVLEKREAKMFNQGAAGAVGPLDPGSCLTRPGLEVERRFVSLREESPAGLLMKFLSYLLTTTAGGPQKSSAGIRVCGHYGCGGVLAALQEWSGLPLENWLAHVRAVYRAHQDELDAAPDENARWRRLCELNVMAQVHAVRETEIVKQAWRKDYPVVVHGWIYDLREGLLVDLDLN